ncbi:MAG TPA: A24 family peptidase [Polyangiales bacterium]|nr:A24 family peptidase [Polyangiales bacterium]
MTALQPVFWPLLLAVVLTGAAAIWDLRTGLIPNRLVAAGAIAAILLNLAVAAPRGMVAVGGALISMLAGLVLVSLVPMLLYRLDGIGGGDVKLLAVVGAALGPYLGIEAELYAFACVVLYAPARLLFEGKLIRSLRTTGALIMRPLVPRHRRPEPAKLEEMTAFRFGPAIFAGTLAVVVLRWAERGLT